MTVRSAVSASHHWRNIGSTSRSFIQRSSISVPLVVRCSRVPPCWTNTRPPTLEQNPSDVTSATSHIRLDKLVHVSCSEALITSILESVNNVYIRWAQPLWCQICWLFFSQLKTPDTILQPFIIFKWHVLLWYRIYRNALQVCNFWFALVGFFIYPKQNIFGARVDHIWWQLRLTSLVNKLCMGATHGHTYLLIMLSDK